MRWRKVTLLGVGLLGGSLGLALRARGLAGRLTGFVRRPGAVPASGPLAAAVDEATADLPAALAGADLVIFCTPIGQFAALAAQAAPHLAPGALITDVGSVKSPVVHQLDPALRAAGARFVGSHPMAGGEQTGVAAARADLFAGTVCAVTPTPRTDPGAVDEVTRLWEALGCRVLILTPERHDELVSRSSHLPHLAAAALVRTVLEAAPPADQAALCAGGFRDTTRVASGAPEMWRDIALANREPLLAALDAFTGELRGLRDALFRGDAPALERFLAGARERRDRWCREPSAGAVDNGE